MQEVLNQEFFKTTFKKMLADCIVNEDLNQYELGKGDQVDQSTMESEYNLSARLKGRNFIYLKKVQTALKRMEEGTFGECQECGDHISSKRLLARPTASKCLSCKEEEEIVSNKLVHKNRYSFRRNTEAMKLEKVQ